MVSYNSLKAFIKRFVKDVEDSEILVLVDRRVLLNLNDIYTI